MFARHLQTFVGPFLTFWSAKKRRSTEVGQRNVFADVLTYCITGGQGERNNGIFLVCTDRTAGRGTYILHVIRCTCLLRLTHFTVYLPQQYA